MKRLFYTLFCLALLGCQQQEPSSKPADLIPEGKMVQILADVHVLESLIESNVPAPDTAVMIYNKRHKEILEKYGVKKDQFHRTYNYYGENLPAMDRLYETVLDTLSVREAKLAAIRNEVLEIDDSRLETLQEDGTTTLTRPEEPQRRRLGNPNRIKKSPLPQ